MTPDDLNGSNDMKVDTETEAEKRAQIIDEVTDGPLRRKYKFSRNIGIAGGVLCLMLAICSLWIGPAWVVASLCWMAGMLCLAKAFQIAASDPAEVHFLPHNLWLCVAMAFILLGCIQFLRLILGLM